MKTLRLVVIGVLLASALSVAPALAHDGDHSGPGSSGPDRHSQNVKLLSNVPRSSAATQSDLAFFGKYAVAGNYAGFRILDVSDPEAPQVVTNFACNGPQSDVSVMGNLLFQSVDSPQSSGACNSTTVTASTPGMFEGVRVFDITDITAPVHVTSIATDCGSHTHTLLPEPENDRAIIYVSSYPLGGAALGPNCSMPHDAVSIIEVPTSDPAAATVTKYHLDAATEFATYLGAFTFRACHDISVFKELDLAAAACLSESQVWDISDPLAPVFMWRFDDPAVNTDDNQGRVWFLDVSTGQKLANYKIPRAQAGPGVCTMHNFNFVPLRDGRKVLVSAVYTGGTTIVDVDKLIGGASEADSEIGFYQPSGSNTWSSYWYNGHIYGNDILRGVDIFLLSDNARAGAVKLDHLNPQTQISLLP